MSPIPWPFLQYRPFKADMHLSCILVFHISLRISWNAGQVITTCTCTCPAYVQVILSYTLPDVQASPSTLYLSCIQTAHTDFNFSWSTGQVITTCICPMNVQVILSYTFPDVQVGPSTLYQSSIQTTRIDLNFSWNTALVITTCTCPAYALVILSYSFPDVQVSPSIPASILCIHSWHWC